MTYSFTEFDKTRLIDHFWRFCANAPSSDSYDYQKIVTLINKKRFTNKDLLDFALIYLKSEYISYSIEYSAYYLAEVFVSRIRGTDLFRTKMGLSYTQITNMKARYYYRFIKLRKKYKARQLLTKSNEHKN